MDSAQYLPIQSVDNPQYAIENFFFGGVHGANVSNYRFRGITSRHGIIHDIPRHDTSCTYHGVCSNRDAGQYYRPASYPGTSLDVYRGLGDRVVPGHTKGRVIVPTRQYFDVMSGEDIIINDDRSSATARVEKTVYEADVGTKKYIVRTMKDGKPRLTGDIVTSTRNFLQIRITDQILFSRHFYSSMVARSFNR